MSIKQHSQPHPRIEIRKRVKEFLDVCVDVGGRIFVSRPLPMWLSEVPTVLVYFNSEEMDDENTRPKQYKRTLELVIEVLQRQENNIDDFLDSRAYEIEYALNSVEYLGLSWVEDVTPLRTIPAVVSGDGNELTQSLRLFYQVVYRFIPEINVDVKEFLKFVTDYETTDGAKATDSVTIRTE